ncbi:hypothetical protein ACF9IK_01670 [Kitasatospora hibisci]|uniref:hypothetical protein n=1 Tax=Kitasatospora hibisci TaxID=3369522 RepID=UPI0037548C04
MGELQEFLDPGPGASQDLDARPGPEGVVLLAIGIEPGTGNVDRGEEQRGGAPVAPVAAGAAIARALDGELFARHRGAGCLQQEHGVPQPRLGSADELRQDGDQGAGALLHPCLPVPGLLDVTADVGLADRAGGGPGRPSGRVFHRPLREVQVEGADRQEHGVGRAARSPVGQDPDALFPRLGDLVGQGERGDRGVVALQVAPEQVGQHLGVVDQGAVVQDGGPLGEVVDEHVADRAVGDRVAVDQLGRGELAAGLGLAQGRWRVLETADGVEDVVGEGQGRDRAAVVPTGLDVVGEVFQVEGQQVLAGDDAHAGEHVQGIGRMLVAALSADALLEFGEQLRLVVATVGVVDAQQPAAEQPTVGGPDRPEDDQDAETGGEPRPGARTEPLGSPARTHLVGTAQEPSVLPGVGGESLQPVEDARQ